MSATSEAEGIITRLEEWAANDTQILPDHFSCRYRDDCSVNGGGCCMSYVGTEYGHGFRLAVVGMDHGEKSRVNFRERQGQIKNGYVIEKASFNPHYAGVVKTAAAILGKSVDHCRTNCVNSCNFFKQEGCVLNRISQPNLVKCTPSTQNGMQSITSSTMKKNCTKILLLTRPPNRYHALRHAAYRTSAA